MEQVFRIEIPVEAVDETDTAALQRLETLLSKLFTTMKNSKSGFDALFDSVESGATDAKSAIKQLGTAFDGVGDDLGDAADAAGDVSNAYKDAAEAAQGAGRRSGSAFDSATSSADKFTQRMEKSNQSLRSMFKEKLKLTLAAVDRASPILKDVWNKAKSVAGKTWHVAVRMKDFITAPFRKLWNMISSPITMALSVAGIGLSAGDIVQTFNEFETGMSAVRALTGATDQEFAMLKQTAKDLGASTSFSASEASEGMQYLAMAGWDTNQIIAAMPGLLDLAAAGATELGTAADIVSDVMTAMGMNAGEASRAADVFARTATRSNTTIEGLGETLKYAAPIAHSFGMQLEEVAAITGMMGDAGIKGSQAGTALRTALLRMASPTEEAATLMEQLGLSFANGDGSMKSMSSILRDTSASFGKLSDAERLAAAQTIFGTEAASAWLAVIDQGPDKYDEFTASLYNAAGAAENMAKIRLDNLAGDMEELGGAVETAKLELMDKLNPYLRSAVQWLTGKIPGVQNLLENALDTGISKAKNLYSSIKEVFNSAKFQNAGSFADKLFIAWDELIADPFDKWWSGGGQNQILGKLGEMGKNAGELLNGIGTGFFAALTGKEINFDGLNLSGLAKAGAEGAKTFISSFLGGLNIGDLFGKAPGLLQAGLLGFGAVKLGGGLKYAVNTFAALKEAILGTNVAAKAASPAFAAVGKGAAVSAASLGKTGSLLGLVKAGLSAIPAWGWAAAAALTAAVVGVKMYTDAQEEQKWALKNSSEATSELLENYKETARTYNEFSDALGEYKEIQLKVESSKTNPQTAAYVQGMLDSIEDKTAQVTVIMSEAGLSSDQIDSFTNDLTGIYTRRAEIEIILSGSSMSATDVTAIKAELDGIQSRKAEIEMSIADGGLSTSEIATLQAEYNSISDREAEIKLMMSGQGIDQAEISALTSELSQIDSKEAEIKAEMSDSGMSASEISEVVDLLSQIGDKQALLNVSLAEGAMGTEELNAYNEQMKQLYGQMVDMSGGVFTQADVDAGRITPERLEAYNEQLRLQEETKLYELEAAVNADNELLPQTIATRDEAKANYDAAVALADYQADEKLFLRGLETERARLASMFDAGLITRDELVAGGQDILQKYSDYFGQDELYGTSGPANITTLTSPEELFGKYGFLGKWKREDSSIFRDAIDSISIGQTASDEIASTHLQDYNSQNAALVQHYENQKGLIEGWAFHASELAGQSLEEVAQSYHTLDESSRKMFDDAVLALNTLNAQTDYLSDGEKTQAVELVDLAAKAEIMSNIKTEVENISAEYQTLSGEEAAAFNTEHLSAVNEALSSLGLEQISSLDQLSGALEALSTVDLSSFSLDAVQSAFTALGGDADGCKTKVEALREAIGSVEGLSTTSTHVHTNIIVNKTIGSVAAGMVTSMFAGVAAAFNAEGGIYDGAMLSWVAEDGPEAIIPLGAKRRERGIDLWLQAGRMLGVSEFSDGGIAAPYAGVLEKLPDESWNPEGDDDNPKPVHIGGSVGGAGPISVSVAANPVFHIDGGESSEDIIAKIKSHQAEIAEILGGAFADQLEDILTNMQ